MRCAPSPIPRRAEIVECAHNATRLSFGDEVWLVAQRRGLNLDPIAVAVARSAEGSTNHRYGIRGGAVVEVNDRPLALARALLGPDNLTPGPAGLPADR